jgi:hypothetical protein
MGALPALELCDERFPVLFVDACDAVEDEEVWEKLADFTNDVSRVRVWVRLDHPLGL